MFLWLVQNFGDKLYVEANTQSFRFLPPSFPLLISELAYTTIGAEGRRILQIHTRLLYHLSMSKELQSSLFQALCHCWGVHNVLWLFEWLICNIEFRIMCLQTNICNYRCLIFLIPYLFSQASWYLNNSMPFIGKDETQETSTKIYKIYKIIIQEIFKFTYLATSQ